MRAALCRLVFPALFLSALPGCVTLHFPVYKPQPESPFGIHGPTYSHWLAAGAPHTWEEGAARLRVLEDSGAGWARQDFWWGLVEPEPGKFQWDDFDRAIAAYERHGIKLLAILCYASKWSAGVSPDNDEERARFAEYVYQMVRRYKGRVGAWEIWNEPNIQPYWSPRPDPELYAKLLAVAYAAAKRADPDCIVVGGVLAGPDHRFLRGMYQAGAGGCFDVLSYHNYGQENNIVREWPEIERLRAIMAEYGDGDKPLWHTETGFFTGPVGLSEHDQAGRIVRYSVGLLALGIERMFQLTLADWTDDPQFHDLSVYRGLTHADYRTKESYRAYQTMCRRLGDKRFVAALRPAPGVSGYLFQGDRDKVLVLWREEATEERPAELDLGVPVALVQQMDGDWRVYRAESGCYTLPIGRDPVYVLNPGPSITNQRRVTWPNPVRTPLPRAADALVEVTVRNPTDMPLRFRVFPAAQPAPTMAVEIPPRQTQRAKVCVDASGLDVGLHEFTWTLEGAVSARGYRLVEVQSPLTLAFEPLRRLRADDPKLPVRVDYSGTQPTRAAVSLSVDGRVAGVPLDIMLKPGEATHAEIPFDLRPFESGDAIPLAVTLDAQGLKLTTAYLRPLIACPRAPEEAGIDGDVREWRASPPQLTPAMFRWEYVNAAQTPPPEDLTVTGWIAYDMRGLWLALEVQDDVRAFPQGRAVWNWDSLQVGLDLGGDALPEQTYDDNDLEIELGARADDADWCYLGACPLGWPQEALSAKLVGIVRPDETRGTVAYELLIPAELLVSVTSLEPDTVIGFSLLVNDNDGSGRSGWLELTPGIGLGKHPAQFAWLWLR